MFAEMCTNLYGGKAKMIEVLENIGTEILKYRELKSLSQVGLGRKLGVSDKSISRYERGTSTPSLKVVIKFLEVSNECKN